MKPQRLFTIEQANSMLPLVRAIATDMANLARELVERRERLAVITAGRTRKTGDVYSEELAQVEAELARDAERLREYVTELEDLGVYPRAAVDGIVDFPAKLDGRAVFLCWKVGDPEVLYFHELDATYSDRTSLTAESLPGGPCTTASGDN
nr:DUF2203 domain-containing protein [Pirellula staleyi]